MYKIVIGNEKGGVGKTAIAVHAAAGLAARGLRVMLVDADPQGHATFSLGLDEGPGFYNLLVRGAGFDEVAKRILPERYGIVGERLPSGVLWVLPGNIETRSIADLVSNVNLIHERFEELEGKVDVVIFDLSPTPNLLHGIIYVAADAILYATKTEILAFDGLAKAMLHRAQAEQMRAEKYGRGSIRVLGIVPTMYRALTSSHQENLASLRKQFGKLVWTPIPERIAWSDATDYRRLVYSLEPNCDAARDVWELVDQFEEAIRVQTS